MSDPFAKLAKEFNQSAGNVGAGAGNWQTTVAKYLLLMRHKTDTPEQKQQLTGTMLDAALDRLDKITEALPGMTQYSHLTLESLYGIFRPLAAPENSIYLPQGATQRVADATLSLLRTLEAYDKHDRVTSENFANIRKNYTEFSFFLLETTQIIESAEAHRAATTQSDITLGKSPTVKSRLGKPS